MTKKVKIIIAAAIAAVLLFIMLVGALLLYCFLTTDSTAKTMRLVRREGAVSVDKENGESVSLIDNLSLYSGYGVATADESYAWINFDETKLAKMDQNSKLRIRKSGKDLSVHMSEGSLFFNVTETLADDESMNIRTSTMVMGIRGTMGWVHVVNDNEMEVYLLKGTVECTVYDENGNVLVTETLTAGKVARMISDPGNADILIEEFDDTPDFVKEELDALGMDASGNNAGGGSGGGSGEEGGREDGLQEDPAHDFSYQIENGEVIIFGHSSFNENVVIPSKIEGYPVRKIGSFSDEQVKTVVLPDTVTEIGELAFARCISMTDIKLSKNLQKIGTSAFSDCKSLKSIDLPDSATELGDSIFVDCDKLETVTHLPGGMRAIPKSMFLHCKSLKSVKIPAGVTTIEEWAFTGCESLTEIDIPSGMTSIGKVAFSECTGLRELTLPDGIKEIGDSAFGVCEDLTISYNGKRYAYSEFDRLYADIRKPSDSLVGAYKVLDGEEPWWCSGELDVTKGRDGRYQAAFGYGDRYASWEDEASISQETDLLEFSFNGGDQGTGYIIGRVSMVHSGTQLIVSFRAENGGDSVDRAVFEKVRDF